MSDLNNNLVKYKRYVSGWLNSSVQNFLGMFLSAPSSMEYALITCLDSDSDLASLFQKNSEFKSLLPKARPLGRGLLLPTQILLEVESRDKVFFGFDEVWFFPCDAIEPKPESGWLVGPARVDQKTLNQLGKWMDANSCTLALGDGEGLNFIVKSAGLVTLLLGHSISQPSAGSCGQLVFEEEHIEETL